RGGDKEAQAQLALIERILPALQAGSPARRLALAAEDRPVFETLQLLTAKPLLYVCNVEEGAAAGGNRLSALVARSASSGRAWTG
ncbi:MAG: hypothetical protein K0S35_3411, partial [Geminicoccaceae bacterium]|nr:hypothetical protein [Geminicoccaceae bacterium]